MGGTIGLAPIGYLNTRSTVEGRNIGTVVVDEERAPLVRWAFEAFATGEWTISTLTEELGNRGLLLRPTKRCPAKPLARSRVAKMLRCPYYVGIVTYKGALHPGRHPALIAPELFEQVQTVLDQRSLGKERPVKRTHYLKGILACGRCGRQLSLSHNVGNMGVRYPYFFCLGRHGSKPNGCDLPFLPMAQVEVDVEKFWSRVRIAEHELRCIRTDVTDLITLGSSQHEGDIAVQRDRLVRLDGEEAKLLQAHYADAVSLSLLKKEQARIRGERNRAESLISSLSLEFAAMQHTLDEALTRVERCDEVYRAGSQQIDESCASPCSSGSSLTTLESALATSARRTPTSCRPTDPNGSSGNVRLCRAGPTGDCWTRRRVRRLESTSTKNYVIYSRRPSLSSSDRMG